MAQNLFMLDSDGELCTGSSIPKHSRLHPTFKERKERDRSLDYLDLQAVSAEGTYLAKPPEIPEVFETPTWPKGKAVTSTSWVKEVEEQDFLDASGEQGLYTLEEMRDKIIKIILEELPFPDSAGEDLHLKMLVLKCIELNVKGCPNNDATVEKIVNHIVTTITGGSPDKTPCKSFAAYEDSASKPSRNCKDVFEPP